MTIIRLTKPILESKHYGDSFGITVGTPRIRDPHGSTTYVLLHNGLMPPRKFLTAMTDTGHILFGKKSLDELVNLYLPVHVALIRSGAICTQEIEICNLKGYSYIEPTEFLALTAVNELYFHTKQ
jgi:hypothetical protein